MSFNFALASPCTSSVGQLVSRSKYSPSHTARQPLPRPSQHPPPRERNPPKPPTTPGSRTQPANPTPPVVLVLSISTQHHKIPKPAKMSSFWLSRFPHSTRKFLNSSLSVSLCGAYKSSFIISPSYPVINPIPNLIPFTGSNHQTSNFKENFRYVSVASISTTPSGVEKETRNTNVDSNEISWIDLYLPRRTRAYAKLARLDKPIGTWLLAWPCMWSITMAASPGHLPDFKLMTLFGCGALLLRGAGCTVNDLIDRDIDNMVERTKLRPVASGFLTPFQGLSFLGFQLLLGLGILLQLNNYSQILGASSLLLVFSYPLMKRFTFWPQAYLGLTFNWGALLGWSAVKGSLDPAVVFPMYISGLFWTLIYDTIYAHQDKEDDLKVGVKSTALRFGDSTKEWITGFGIACISCLALSGFNADIGWPYYASLAAASGQLAWQIWTVDLSSRADCNRKFDSNKWFGAIVFSGILFGRLAQ